MSRYIKVDDLQRYCDNQKDHSITPNDFQRMNFIELPDKHGRLGDLDLCLKTFKIYCQDCKKEIDCYSCWVSDTFDVVKGIPTVLEATNEVFQ